MLQLSSSEGVNVVSIIVDEWSTRILNILHTKSILHFRLLVFPALAILRGGDGRVCVVCFGAEHTHTQSALEGAIYVYNLTLSVGY